MPLEFTQHNKIKILNNITESAQYIERHANMFIYSFLGSDGSGLVHQIKPSELDSFLEELYTSTEKAMNQIDSSIVVDKNEIQEIKDLLNV